MGAIGGGAFAADQAVRGAAPRSGRLTTRPTAEATRPSPVPPRRLPVGTAGSYAVGRVSLMLVDRSRPLLGSRVLPTTVYYPAIPANPGRLARGLFPLVVFAPGYRQCDGAYSDLLRDWASAGYVIAAVQFPRTNCHVPDPDEDDLSNQPGDVSYVISRMVAISGEPRGVLAGLVNPARIAVAGHSDGGDTVAAVAADACCRDNRVDAAIVLAGAEWPPLPGRYFATAVPPILFVQGSADSWNPPAASRQLYQADDTGPRYYLDLFRAGHFAPYEGDGQPEPLVASVSTAFLDRYLAGQGSAAAAMSRVGNVPGIAALVSGGQLPA